VINLPAYDSVAHSILARHLQTPIEDAVWIELGEPIAEARDRLGGRFDQAPVRDQGKLVGFVVTNELDAMERTADALHPLDEHMLESADAAVGDVIRGLLPDRPLLFVVDGHRISGFITPSDLNKHPARFHFYLLLADLEMSLATAVLAEFTELRDALFVLDKAARGKITGRFDRDTRARVEANLAAAMDLGHLLIVGYTSERLRSAFLEPEFEGWMSTVEDLVALRNAVMHPTLAFVGPERGLTDLIRTEERIGDWLNGLENVGLAK
jgi:hypothetical protein